MIDYSFLRLKNNIHDALDIQDPIVATHYFYNPIQLIPNKTYLQITNVTGGISLDSDCEVFIVDCKDNVLADVTNTVFIEEFTDSKGQNQCKIEFLNLGVDFYRQTVLIKFDMLTSDDVYYTNPINITSYQSERTVFFKYKNYDDYLGIGYTNANVWQSISLSMYFDIPLDETETENYFQISRENTISTRALRKIFEQYKIEQINRFTYKRLNALLKHELIYLDDVRVTDKPTIPSSERQGDSNYFETDLIVSKDYTDVSPYSFQIFEGIKTTSFTPSGNYTSGASFSGFGYSIQFNTNVTLNTGTLNVYSQNNILLGSLEVNSENSQILDGDILGINVTSVTDLELPPDGIYYVNLTANTVHFNNIGNNAIEDDTTWTFSVGQPADFNSSDFDSPDFLTD